MRRLRPKEDLEQEPPDNYRKAEVIEIANRLSHSSEWTLYRPPSNALDLVQVCANTSAPVTLEREVRSLIEAKTLNPEVRTLLILLDPLPAGTAVPDSVELVPAIQWFLGGPEN